MDEGMNPLEAAMSATGACLGIVAASFAEAKGFTFEDFSIDVQGDLDPDGFTYVADVPKGFQQVSYTMNFKTSEPQEKCEEVAKFVEETCPICCTFYAGVKVVCSGVNA